MVRKSIARQASQTEKNPKSNRKESYARINPVASKEKECERKYAEVKEFYKTEFQSGSKRIPSSAIQDIDVL